jgi:hypothetical protein
VASNRLVAQSWPSASPCPSSLTNREHNGCCLAPPPAPTPYRAYVRPHPVVTAPHRAARSAEGLDGEGRRLPAEGDGWHGAACGLPPIHAPRRPPRVRWRPPLLWSGRCWSRRGCGVWLTCVLPAVCGQLAEMSREIDRQVCGWGGRRSHDTPASHLRPPCPRSRTRLSPSRRQAGSAAGACGAPCVLVACDLVRPRLSACTQSDKRTQADMRSKMSKCKKAHGTAKANCDRLSLGVGVPINDAPCPPFTSHGASIMLQYCQRYQHTITAAAV